MCVLRFQLPSQEEARRKAIVLYAFLERKKYSCGNQGEMAFGRKKIHLKKVGETIGEKATMVLACFLKHVSESLPPANTGKFSKL